MKTAIITLLFAGISITSFATKKKDTTIIKIDSSFTEEIKKVVSEVAELVEAVEQNSGVYMDREVTEAIKEKSTEREYAPRVKDKNANTDRFRFLKRKRKKTVKVNWCMLDLGINSMLDHTDYSSTATQNFLKVDPSKQNDNLFSLRQAKSINVNLWPVMASIRAVDNSVQRLFLSSGLGFQFYNYRFSEPVSFKSGVNPYVYFNDTTSFSKNKLAFTYLSMPLMLTGQTKVGHRSWLTYGAGVIGGIRIASWTKQVSRDFGKVKDRGSYNLNPFQLSVTGELGVKGVLRLYGTYHLTNLWKNDALKQQPFAVGVRFFGI